MVSVPYIGMLAGPGMPDMYAQILAGADASIANGELAGISGELSALIGRPTTPIADTIAEALRQEY